MKFTLEEADVYAKQGKAKEWVIKLLRHTGNEGFSKHLENNEGKIGELIELDLFSLKRICGPENGMKYFEEKDVWEKRVLNMVKDIKNGWDVPPLIVWNKDGELSIADGAHRYEALIRCEFKKYWVFVWKDN